jgi:ATP-dependent Lhr-like helicase
MSSAVSAAHRYARQRKWRIATFQSQCWAAYASGHSGLLNAPTGSGKTYAVWGGVINEAVLQPPLADTISVLWITPLRALASDSLLQLQEPLTALGLDLRVARRTGDLTSSERKRLRQHPPFALVTTPESLALMLSYPEQQQALKQLRCVIVDEWHELLGNKRGVLLQLALARLRMLNPTLKVWGISATLANLQQARDVLCPGGLLIRAELHKKIQVESLRPAQVERYPWAGHLGLKQLPRVLKQILRARSSLVFTNTRSQTELWHQALAAVWPEDESTLALHHGSLDREQRQMVEQALKAGSLRAVVCTSSLDLGVDFGYVEQVIQIGSPKGVARLLQRAGRCGHAPGQTSRIYNVATHALELAEIAAARAALALGQLEPREPPMLSLDVLAQHLVTIALGSGFVASSMFAEVRQAWSFADLSVELWTSVLKLITEGGDALARYPDFHRVEIDADGRYGVPSKRIALLHRMAIGTISADSQIEVRYLNGARLGRVEENFLARLRAGERFLFAGRSLELVRINQQTAFVKRSQGRPASVPQWMGSKLPLSNELASALRVQLAGLGAPSAEMTLLAPLLDLQQALSHRPAPNECLVEQFKLADGWQLCVYPFAGRLVHEGLAALFAQRLAKGAPNTFSMAVNDYGFCLSAARAVHLDHARWTQLIATSGLLDDIRASLNMSELARRQFREVARIAGMLHNGPPGRLRSQRQLQMSAGLLFDVLREHDPEHLLLAQAETEILENQLDYRRLQQTLRRLQTETLVLRQPARLTPLSFPLWAERMRQHAGNESWESQVAAAAAALGAQQP